MLLWFADVMNVTEEVTIHRLKVSTLLSSAFTPDESTRQECWNVGSMNCNFFSYIHYKCYKYFSCCSTSLLIVQSCTHKTKPGENCYSSAIILDLFVVFRIFDSLMTQFCKKESDSRVNQNEGKWRYHKTNLLS